MIDVSAEGLANEVKQAIEHRDTFLGEPYREAVRRFYGPAYKTRYGQPAIVDYENHAHAWISVFLPVLASGNPRMRGRTPRLGGAAAFAKACELAGNRNFELTDVKRTIEQLATDWAFKYCVGLTTPVPVKGLREREDPPHRPTTRRMSLDDYIWDPLARQHAETRFQGHKIVRDKDSLLDEAAQFPERSWNTDAIQSLDEDHTRQRMRERVTGMVHRQEVEFWELWIPEITLEDAVDVTGKKFQPDPDNGYNGTIYTIDPERGTMLRSPRPFWGPRDGMYTFSGYLYVPDESVGLSPLAATAAQAEEFNKMTSSAMEAMRRFKIGFAVSSESGGLEEKLAEFQDLGVFTVDGAMDDLAKHFMQVQFGGITPQHLQALDTLRSILERASGLTEAKQGLASGAATATEASIAEMGSGKRMGYMTEKFVQSVVKPIAKKEIWYLAMDPRSRIGLGDLASGLFIDPKTGKPIENPVMQGGPEHGDYLEDLDIEIQPLSMRFTTEMLEAERQASWEQFLLSTAPMIPSLPYVDWGLVYQRKAESLGDPSLARTIDIEKAMMMGMIQMQMQIGQMAQGVTTQPTSVQPRLGIDTMKQQPPKAPSMPALKSSESPRGFSKNARPQPNKGPRMAGASATTRSTSGQEGK